MRQVKTRLEFQLGDIWGEPVEYVREDGQRCAAFRSARDVEFFASERGTPDLSHDVEVRFFRQDGNPWGKNGPASWNRGDGVVAFEARHFFEKRPYPCTIQFGARVQFWNAEKAAKAAGLQFDEEAYARELAYAIVQHWVQ